MNSQITYRVIKRLSEKYNISTASIRDIINRYYSCVASNISDNLKGGKKYKDIRIRFFGRFEVKPFINIRTRMEMKTRELMKINKKEYDIVLQTEPHMLLENNEEFYFNVTDKDTPEMSIGDRIEIIYHGQRPKNKIHSPIMEMEILDAKHPFYSGAIDLDNGSNEKPQDLYIFKRNKLTKIRI